jgi:hypothetical protein
LKAKVEKHRDGLREKSGVCMFSESGPVGMVVIDALVAAIESQQKQIDELNRKS